MDLRAQIAPLGAATSYHFEYGSNGVWATRPKPGWASVGWSDGGAVASVVRPVAGLPAGTTTPSVWSRRMRSKAGWFWSRWGFTTLPLAGEGLPDGRAYELVTPPDKGGAEDMFCQKF